MKMTTRTSGGLKVAPSSVDDSRRSAKRKSRTTSSSSYGLRALATVVFDIDSGQHLDALYPATSGLSDDARQSIAHLALPHSNKQDEGDTQFIVRFRESNNSNSFLYGFVLFRQQRDSSRSRGYNQRALVIVSDEPYVDLYDRVLRVAGPLFFQVGNTVLEALFENMSQWPAIVKDTPLSLPLAGTFISCVIPDLLDYEHVEHDQPVDVQSPSPTAHFIGDDEDGFDSDEGDDDEPADGDHHLGTAPVDDTQVMVEEGRFVVDKRGIPPSPSFGDVLMAKRSSPSTPFESIGLYSSFMGLENCLWQLWQLAITGESLIVLSPHARECSQATLAYTSLIAPLQFNGDYRPYYALYEKDFDEIASRQTNGVSSPESMTVIGTTNPFFMKTFKKWPNAIIFPFLESKDKSASPRPKTVAGLLLEDSDADCVSIRIKSNVDLDTLEDSDRAILLRRRPRYVQVDNMVLNQLVSPPEVYVSQTASAEEEPYMAINNAILRRHFRKLTKRFLHPFDQYFGVWKSNNTNSNLYISVEEVLKPFDLKSFLASVNPRNLPPQIKRSKWRSLYTAFIRSPHFEPWFTYKRRTCVYQLTQTLRDLRASVTSETLLTSPCGKPLTLEECEALEREILHTLEIDRAHHEASGGSTEPSHIQVSEGHLRAVRARIREHRKH